MRKCKFCLEVYRDLRGEYSFTLIRGGRREDGGVSSPFAGLTFLEVRTIGRVLSLQVDNLGLGVMREFEFTEVQES